MLLLRKKFLGPIIIIFVIVVFLCMNNGYTDDLEVENDINLPKEEMSKSSNITILEERVVSKKKYDDIIDEHYLDNDIKITYPQFSMLKPRFKIDEINNLIKNEALRVLENYNENVMYLSLEIDYEISLKNDNVLSVIFYGDGYVENMNHNNKHFYTTNINLNTGEKIYLNYIKFDKNLVDIIINKNYGFKMYDEYSEIIYNVNDLFPFNEFKKCDYTGSEIYSYFTENSLGISFSVPYAIGGHKEIEILYNELGININGCFG